MAKVSHVGVVGSGSMGNGIAQVGAQAGYQVTLYDIAEPQLERARGTIQKSLAKLEEKKQLKDSASAVFGRIKTTTRFEELKSIDFLIEAATENREVKFKLFRDLDN